MHWIASQGHEHCVDIIMKHPGTTSLVSNKDGRTPLHEAAMKGHAKIVEKIFKYDVFLDHENIDKVDYHNRTALHWAVLGNHGAIVELLIRKGASVKIISTDGKSALNLAANADKESILQTIFRAWAAQGGDKGIVQVFLDHGKNQVDTKDWDQRTLLSYASERGHDDIVKLLIEKGADIEVKDGEYGRTPLSWAAWDGHEGVIKLLVEKGADIKAKDNEGQTPLSSVTEERRERIYKFFERLYPRISRLGS